MTGWPHVRYDGREEIVLPAMPAFRRTASCVVAAALLAAAGWFFEVPSRIGSFRTRMAVERLAESSPQSLPVARFSALSGRARVEAGAVMRGGRDSSDARARAANVQQLAASASNAEGRSAEAVSLVMSREWSTAVLVLEKAVAAEPASASLWSDLAAARYERGVAREEVEELLPALVAADRSRRLDPENRNALFNRALILEKLGLRTVAGDAWRAVLDGAVDPMLEADAHRRLKANEPATWLMVQSDLERAAAAGDVATVERIVAQFPQDARAYGDVIYLTRWANAYLGGDRAEAAKNLQITRACGAALRNRGETLLSDAVAAVDATHDEARLRTLAQAQQAYDLGRDAYLAFRYVDAERLFAEAARGYEAAGTPMALVARSFLAFQLLEQNRTQEAHERFTSLAATIRARPGYRALLGFLLWMQGRCDLLRGQWDPATAALRESRAIFIDLGERKNVGGVDTLLADTFHGVGRTDLAWQHCVAAFRGVSEERNLLRLQVALAVGVRIAMGTKAWDVAASLLDVELAVAEDLRQPALTADALRRLYVVQNERKELEARDVALARARIAVAHAGDESRNQTALLDQAEAMIAMQSDPRRAAVLFTRALELATASDRRVFVADLLRNRGRAHLAAGDEDAAWTDFAAGIDELERQRGRIATAELRTRFFDTANALFADAVGLLVRRGDAARAFAYADRARARALLEPGDAAAVQAPTDIPAVLAARLPDTALLEIAVLDGEVVVFCVRNGNVTMHRSPIAAAALRARIAELRRRVAYDSPERIRAAGSELYGLLFGGARASIESAGSLVIVPDDALQHVPFAALWRPSAGQYLGQSHVVSIAPSAALLVSRTTPVPPRRAILLVGNSAGDERESLAYLSSVEDEIAALRKVYRASRVMLGRDASKARFIAEAGSYDVIHFAGHGLSDDESLQAALLFAPGATNDAGRMSMGDIAQLRLARAPLVVLAACGTLRGRTGGIEGMPSLARSFLAAGAATVIGTVQDIDDATAGRLLASFHRSIAAGTSPATALRDAQRDAIARGGEDAHPKHWAPYVVYTATP